MEKFYVALQENWNIMFIRWLFYPKKYNYRTTELQKTDDVKMYSEMILDTS